MQPSGVCFVRVLTRRKEYVGMCPSPSLIPRGAIQRKIDNGNAWDIVGCVHILREFNCKCCAYVQNLAKRGPESPRYSAGRFWSES